MGMLHVGSAHKISVRPLKRFPTVRVVAVGLITYSLLVLFVSIIPIHLRLIVVPPIGFLIYVIGAFATGIVSWTNIKQIVSV